MGNLDCSKQDDQNNTIENNDKIKASDLTKINRIGKGALSLVWKVLINPESGLKQPDASSQKNNSSF